MFGAPEQKQPHAERPPEPHPPAPDHKPDEKKSKPRVVLDTSESPSLPSFWPNGSAVFRDKSTHGGWPSNRLAEERDGFLGRYVKRADGAYDVWRWKQGGYAYGGAAPDHMTAFSML